MKQEIENSIKQRKQNVDKNRELIIGINNAIENNGFRPSESQQVTIDYICQKGKEGLLEIEKLESFKLK